MRENKTQCSFCLSVCLTVIAGFIMLWSVIYALPSLLANKETCHLVNVTYPSENNTNPNNYINCNCGRGCSEDWGYCVRVLVQLDNSTYLTYDDVSNSIYKTECTFTERICSENKNQSFEKAKTISNPFLNKINQSISCYEHDGDVYLYNNEKNRNITLMSVMIGITTISLMILLLLFKNK